MGRMRDTKVTVMRSPYRLRSEWSVTGFDGSFLAVELGLVPTEMAARELGGLRATHAMTHSGVYVRR